MAVKKEVIPERSVEPPNQVAAVERDIEVSEERKDVKKGKRPPMENQAKNCIEKKKSKGFERISTTALKVIFSIESGRSRCSWRGAESRGKMKGSNTPAERASRVMSVPTSYSRFITSEAAKPETFTAPITAPKPRLAPEAPARSATSDEYGPRKLYAQKASITPPQAEATELFNIGRRVPEKERTTSPPMKGSLFPMRSLQRPIRGPAAAASNMPAETMKPEMAGVKLSLSKGMRSMLTMLKTNPIVTLPSITPYILYSLSSLFKHLRDS